jgi:hypothetical protein
MAAGMDLKALADIVDTMSDQRTLAFSRLSTIPDRQMR